MKALVIIFGGDSAEHDVSVLTGLHCARNVTDDYSVHLVYLTRNGQMVTSGATGKLSRIETYIKNNAGKAKICFFSHGCLYRKSAFGVRKVCTPVAVVNCCHGGVGEDGRLAAMLDTANVPVTSSPCFAATVIQSKLATRELLTKAKFAQPKYVAVKQTTPVEDIITKLNFPIIVKPDTLGSSIGISVAKTEAELAEALNLAFELDTKAVAEQYFSGIREINCSAFRYRDKINVSKCEVVTNDGPILDFSAKYLTAASGFVKKSANSKENIPEQAKIQELTKRAYELFGARGVIRADFIIHNGKIFLNEINSVPGFLCYHLWLKSGIPYGTLVSLLAKQAAHDAQKTLRTVFPSEIFEKNRSLV